MLVLTTKDDLDILRHIAVAFAPGWSPPALTARGIAACRLSDFRDAWAQLAAADRAWFAAWLTELLVDACLEDAGAYQVFLTPGADCNGLYVAGKTLTTFEVRELRASTGSLPFSYRVVAKRKGAAGKRLERVERPRGLSAQELELPKLPDVPPAAPEKPTPGDRPGPRPPIAC